MYNIKLLVSKLSQIIRIQYRANNSFNILGDPKLLPVDYPTLAQDLKVGDDAPSMAITEWVQGEAVAGFEKGKVYLVEFWATW